MKTLLVLFTIFLSLTATSQTINVYNTCCGSAGAIIGARNGADSIVMQQTTDSSLFSSTKPMSINRRITIPPLTGAITLPMVFQGAISIPNPTAIGSRTPFPLVSDSAGMLSRLNTPFNPDGYWKTTGNAGTTAGTNFVGTTDNQELLFKANNWNGLSLLPTGEVYIATRGNNSLVGAHPSFDPNTASQNVAFNGLDGLSTGTNNTSIGLQTGIPIATGSNNTFVGYMAGCDGDYSNATAIGANAYAGAINTLVLGSINGVNGAGADANVGIGTTTPTNRLHVVGDSVRFDLTSGERVLFNDTYGILVETNGLGTGITVLDGAVSVSASSGAQGTFVIDADTASVSSQFVKISTSLTMIGDYSVPSLLRYIDGNQAAGKVLTSDAAGNGTWQNQLNVVVDGGGTLLLSSTQTPRHYSFSGTTSTWTLPTVTSGEIIYIKNRGSGNITLDSNGGGNDIYDTAAVNTFAITPGQAYMLISDGTYWNVE